jgi:hypothetical protein
MLKNKQSSRAFIAFVVTWAFAILTVTGIVLYVVPQGRIAYWIHWSFLGLGKEQWGDLHMVFGGLFIATGIYHLYFNWKPFKKYLADRVKGHLQIKRELVGSLLLSLVIIMMSIYALPPVNWVFDLNDWLKAAWVKSPEMEPPFGHAEEVSLGGISKRMRIDLPVAMQALQKAGIRFEGAQQSLEKIALANNTTPMAVYAVIRPHMERPEKLQLGDLSPEELEAHFAGTGLGRKSLAEVCQEVGVETTVAIQRLAEQGIDTSLQMSLRELAGHHGNSPVGLVKIILKSE